jgi:hypothetical protein
MENKKMSKKMSIKKTSKSVAKIDDNLDYNCLTCHIVGFNPILKQEFINLLNPKLFNPIDLDEINQKILLDNNMDTMFKSYQKMKNNKNDKFKDIDKKMSLYWENSFLESLGEKIKLNKKNILIGQNNHYKSLSKKVNLNTPNKFYLKNSADEISNLIKYNLDTYRNDIISGNFPIENLDYEHLSKKRENVMNAYKKNGYLEKDYEQIKTIMNLIESNTVELPGLWISMKEAYNLGSKIHPKKNDKILAYTDPSMALFGSFNFEKDELKKYFNGKEIKIKELKPQILDKLKEKRFLYLVDKNSFMPHEKGANQKFFSQNPVVILQKEKINDVHSYLLDSKAI